MRPLWVKADMCSAKTHVRFEPQAGIRTQFVGHLQTASLVVGRVFTIKEATVLKKVVLTVGLIAVPSIAPAQQQPQQQPQQQCQLECTWVTQKRETRVRSCYALNASDCANLGRAESGGNKTCQGYITSNCVQGR